MYDRRLAHLCATALATIPGSALAQSSPTPASSGGLTDIVVTAQRRSESLQNVPLAISALDSKKIKEAGFRDIADLTSVVPNLNISNLWGTSNPKIFMRGIGNNNFNQTAESKVAVYLDQVYLSAPSGQLFQMYDLDRVEVLRGPQGTLYGKNATGGAISVYSKLPGRTFEGYARAGYGNYNAKELEGAVTLPVSSTLSTRFAGTWTKRDGYVHDLGTGHMVNDVDQWAARGIFRWRPSPGTDLQLNIHGGASNSTHNNSEHRGLFDPAKLALGQIAPLDDNAIIARQGVDILGYRDPNPDPYTNTYERDTFARIKLFGVSLNGTVDLGSGYTLASVTGYENSKRHVLQDGNGAPSTIFTIDWGPSNFSSVSQELRLTSPAADRFSWLAGVFAFREKGRVHNYYDLSSVSFALGFNAFDQYYIQRTSTFAGFLQGKYKITDRLGFTLGGRLNYEKKRLDHRSFAANAVGVSALPGPLFDLHLAKGWSQWSGRAALDYKASDNLLLFASVNRGFTSGGFNTGAFNDPVGAARTFNPEVVVSYEAGMKLTAFERRLRFNATAFDYNYRDLQVFTFTASGLQFIENASNARIRGLEFEVQAVPLPNLELGASVGFLSSKYLNFSRTTGGVTEDLSGNRLIGAPKTELNLVGKYSIPTSVGKLWVRGDFSYTGNRYYDERQRRTLSSEGGTKNVNASLGWTSPGGKYEVNAWVKNLTKEVNIEDVVEVGLFGYQNVWYNQPRTYGLSLSASF